MICCVRSLAWIIDSFERLYHANALQPSRIFNLDQVNTVYGRSELLTGTNGIVRIPYEGLQEAYFGEHADRLLLIQYDSLARSPEATMAATYEFLGERPFTHDYMNVEFEADEFDRSAGSPGLHRVRREVRYRERPTILPVEIFRKFDKPFSFWIDPAKNVRNVKII
jgi:sulfotransferase